MNALVIKPIIPFMTAKAEPGVCKFGGCTVATFCPFETALPPNKELCFDHAREIEKIKSQLKRVLKDNKWFNQLVDYMKKCNIYERDHAADSSVTIYLLVEDNVYFIVTSAHELVCKWFFYKQWSSTDNCVYYNGVYYSPDCHIFDIIFSCIQRELKNQIKSKNLQCVDFLPETGVTVIVPKTFGNWNVV